MTAKDEKPCKKCGENDWNNSGQCRRCKSEYEAARRKDNPGWGAERSRNYRAAHPDREAASQSKYTVSNRSKRAAASREYKAKNLDKVKIANREYQKNNPEKSRARTNKRRTAKTNAGGSYTAAEFRQLCNQYENKCLRCGRDDVKLTADHVMPVAMGGSSDISNIQPLCKSCNSSKGATFKDYRNKPIPERWETISIFDVIGE